MRCESLGDACWWIGGLQLQWIARQQSRGGEECLPSTCSIAVWPSTLGHYHCLKEPNPNYSFCSPDAWAMNMYPDLHPWRLLGTFPISWVDQSKVIKHQKFWPLPAMLGGVCGIWVSFGRGPVKPLTNRATWLWGWPKEYIGAFKCHQRGTCQRAMKNMKETYILWVVHKGISKQ